jgi:hypothetical protein
MRRASRQRRALARTTSSTPSAQSSLAPSPPASSLSNGAASAREFGNPPTGAVDPPATAVVISPAGTFVNDQTAKTEPDGRPERHRQLAITIRQRIESRLGGRVRELFVRIKGDTILLEGKCSTYYTKQLAQHAALGVLEDEHLENAILVEVPR